MPMLMMRHLSCKQLNILKRKSFVSREDFRISNSNESNNLNEIDLLTPKTRRSRGTSAGRPDFLEVKNNLTLGAINDSISSN